MINIWPYLKFFSPPGLCWAGYGPGLVIRSENLLAPENKITLKIFAFHRSFDFVTWLNSLHVDC